MKDCRRPETPASRPPWEIVAYLDSDAYPPPEWPYYLALGFDSRTVGGVGGPNAPPTADPTGAEVVAQSPGGPVHVLLTDDRAEHLPGCNMAFWRKVLVEVGGFDPVYTAAGDDVDLCWKVLDRDWDLGFHPAALVWHHRRPGLRPYLRQQRGYGKAEALVQARHPDRFTGLGTARWSGQIYSPGPVGMSRPRIYHGVFGTAGYQSVYRARGHALDVAHQVGVPLAAAVATIAGASAIRPEMRPVGLGAGVVLVMFLAALVSLDMAAARVPRGCRHPWRFRASVAVHHLLQPLVRAWARWRATTAAWRDAPGPVLALPAAVPSGSRVVADRAERPSAARARRRAVSLSPAGEPAASASSTPRR